MTDETLIALYKISEQVVKEGTLTQEEADAFTESLKESREFVRTAKKALSWAKWLGAFMVLQWVETFLVISDDLKGVTGLIKMLGG